MRISLEESFEAASCEIDKVAYNYWFRKQFQEDDYEAFPIKGLLYKAIELELSDTQKTYFNLYYFEGLNCTEIAEQCGVNKSTVSRTLKKSRYKLLNALKYTNSKWLKIFEDGKDVFMKRRITRR